MISVDLGKYLDESQVRNLIDSMIQDTVKRTIDDLAVDPIWIDKIENLINQTYSQKISAQLSTIDLDQLLVATIDQGIERWQDRLKKDFKTNGISDMSTANQLTVLDDGVIVDNGIAAKNLLIEKDAQINGSITAHDLVVKGSVNTDNESWNELKDTIADRTVGKLTDTWRNELVDEVLLLAKRRGINFNYILLEGEPLVQSNRLNPNILETSITKLGVLRDLQVDGAVQLGSTLHVDQKRVGINTKNPDMALSIWDEEVSLVSGKYAENKAFIGSGKNQALILGINRKPLVEIDTDGITNIKSLRVDRFQIGHASEVPGWSGTRGDIMFNSDPKDQAPFAWICLGGFRWQPVKLA